MIEPDYKVEVFKEQPRPLAFELYATTRLGCFEICRALTCIGYEWKDFTPFERVTAGGVGWQELREW